jgi:hypothetical protein
MFIIEKVCIRTFKSITRTRTIPENYTEFLFKKEKKGSAMKFVYYGNSDEN